MWRENAVGTSQQEEVVRCDLMLLREPDFVSDVVEPCVVIGIARGVDKIQGTLAEAGEAMEEAREVIQKLFHLMKASLKSKRQTTLQQDAFRSTGSSHHENLLINSEKRKEKEKQETKASLTRTPIAHAARESQFRGDRRVA